MKNLWYITKNKDNKVVLSNRLQRGVILTASSLLYCIKVIYNDNIEIDTLVNRHNSKVEHISGSTYCVLDNKVNKIKIEDSLIAIKVYNGLTIAIYDSKNVENAKNVGTFRECLSELFKRHSYYYNIKTKHRINSVNNNKRKMKEGKDV